eukprot:8613732-Pyramimonas_sp.AAC.1
MACGGSGGYNGNCAALGSCGGNCGVRQAAVGTVVVAGLQRDMRGAAAVSAVVAGLQWKLQLKGVQFEAVGEDPGHCLEHGGDRG